MTDKPPSLDQDGKMINPHNPEFITKVPWYLGDHGPTLKHHSIQKRDHVLSIADTDSLISQKVSAQKITQSKQKTSFRKGACRNCGAITHAEKDCLERPRSAKSSAWKTGIGLAADDVVLNLSQHGKLSYAAKRDSWQGYDPNEHQEVIARHERLEAERLKDQVAAKEKQEKKTTLQSGDNSDSDGDSDGEDFENRDKKEFVAGDEDARDFQGQFVPQGGVGGAGMRVTVRNLRLREDTPKYLRNLSLDSAFYDPKSRSMRANPYPNANPEDVPYAGDNFLRYSGDAIKLSQNQVLCWEMQSRGENVDVISNPSQAEMIQKLHSQKKEAHKSAMKEELLKQYGDQSTMKLDPRLLLGQSERYVEYDREGKSKDSRESQQMTVTTKYCEDEFPLNHLSVWGSYFDRESSSWGYSCCHSTLKNSYCVGLGTQSLSGTKRRSSEI